MNAMYEQGENALLRSLFILWAFSLPLRAQDIVRMGPMDIETSPIGPALIRYQGEVLMRNGSFVGYTPEWASSRFRMEGCQRSAHSEPNEYVEQVWEKSSPDNATVSMHAWSDGQTTRFWAEARTFAAGPSEFAIQIVPEAVEIDATRCLVSVNGRLEHLPLDRSLDQISGLKDLVFHQPTRRIRIQTTGNRGGWVLQDRREKGQGFFLVVVLAASGKEPVETRHEVTLCVEEIPDEERTRNAAFVAQVPTEMRDLSVVNPGFEDQNLQAWSKNAYASVDSEIRHREAQSACIRIDEGQEAQANPYIVQNVSVRPGGRYTLAGYVRTENVKAATVGGKSSTGGTLIIEFADPKGKWFAAGKYAKGIYGSADWEHLECEEVMAPAGAGYAILFLALRATGTVWFDDISLSEVSHHIVLSSPGAGETVFDNTPSFVWDYPSGVPFELQLSRDSSFPEEGLIRTAAPSLSLSLKDSIDQGTWFWRVACPDHQVTSAAWSFQQTAPLSADTTEPEIYAAHGWISESRGPLSIAYSDNVGVTDLKLVRNGVDVSHDVRKEKERAFYEPQADWQMGLNRLAVTVSDEGGNLAEKEIWCTHTPPLPRITWCKRGGISFDGEKRFLLGMYGVNVENMPVVAEAGFDFVHSYAWDGAGDNASALAYLDAAKENGLQAFIGFNRRELIKGNHGFVAERVGALMTHPALLAWYLFDEPALSHQYVSPERLASHYRLIKNLDPFHPVVVTVAHDYAAEAYNQSFDVHWTQVYGSTAFVAGRMKKHRPMIGEDKSLAAILHCYDRDQTNLIRSGGNPDLEAFQPDARILRANAYMALAHNSSGLIWWWYGYGQSDRFLTVAQAPQVWEAFRHLIHEIKSLSPVLTAEGEIHTWIERPSEGTEVHLWEKRCRGETLLIAVNRDETPCEIAIVPKTLKSDDSLAVIWEDRTIHLESGSAKESFLPLGVHVYKSRTARQTE